ncbi:hydantoinase B/oxoprolinase family protein [Burkholderia dolosa]|uniref:hydantoinase B/oxoprolinase family protein n=1 Tax=Burkholderia dolosa TaxID=152500 RepID=UPI0027D34BA6|nr:hydantoinase B/oxoprolinase family protein [Burkholderia dolosa]
MTIDPVTLAVTQNRLDHITQQMGWVMLRTARSPIFSQSHDFSCFIATDRGEVIAQADGIPIHTGSGGFAIRALLKVFGDTIAPEDVFLLNDPYLAGGNHLPDWVIARPAFVDGRLVGFACNRAHQADIGGGAAGTYNPEATEIYHEGIRIPPLRLVGKGTLREDLWALLLANSRASEALDGDLSAMLGSTRIGLEGIEDIAREHGYDATQSIFEGMLASADLAQRTAFASLPAGEYTGEDYSDNDCFGPADVWVKVKLGIDGDGNAVVDFTGSSPQVKGFKNSSLANTTSAVSVAIASFFDPELPNNEGRFRSVRIIAPAGTIVNPVEPAPLTMCTTFCAHEIIHALWQALAKAAPERACAGWGKNIFGVTSGVADGARYVMYHANAACGAGAVDGRDGFNSIGHVASLGGFVLPNIEVYEAQFPVLYRKQEFRTDTGGPGKYRGGTGVDYEVTVFGAASYSFRGEGLRYTSSFGVHGGAAGACGEMTIGLPSGETSPAPKYGIRHYVDATVTAASPGGGGWGRPCDRDPASVLRDVRDGVVSAHAARAVYRVALTGDRRAVDQAATEALRASI